MAFMGVILGLFARVAAAKGVFISDGFESEIGMDPEMGMPLLLKHVLPIGLMGLMLSAYFSAIMSTADSCLLAASGNFMTDILGFKDLSKKTIRISQIITFFVGGTAIIIATTMQSVLELMLLSYSFMVSGLLVPVLGILLSKKRKPLAALLSMIVGGASTLILTFLEVKIPYDFDPILIGISLSSIVYLSIKK
jgi:SSS family solute:Na+ symporter